jgi:tetratricopeptide (TPR) repeat protein
MTPDEAALAAFAALRRRDWAGAIEAADALRAPDCPALEARAAAYRAQALRELGRLDEAERSAAAAVQLAKRAGDTDGVTQLRGLHASILAGLAATRAAAKERTGDAMLAELADDVLLGDLLGGERAAVLVRKAGALADAGQVEACLAVTERAVTEARAAGAPREHVLALLCAARVSPEPAASIMAAHRVADATGDMNLVTAVARAARAAGVVLPAPGFG